MYIAKFKVFYCEFAKTLEKILLITNIIPKSMNNTYKILYLFIRFMLYHDHKTIYLPCTSNLKLLIPFNFS